MNLDDEKDKFTEDMEDVLRDQIHAQQSEIIRLNARIRELESQVFGGSVK